MVEEDPCPPVVSRAKGEKTDPVAAQMASYLVCLRSSARFALVRTSLRGSLCSPASAGPGWRPSSARLMNSWLVTPIGLVDVTSRYQLRAAGLSMVVMPERRMSACSLPPGKGFIDERRRR